MLINVDWAFSNSEALMTEEKAKAPIFNQLYKTYQVISLWNISHCGLHAPLATSKHEESTKVVMKSSEMLSYFHGIVQSDNVQSFYYLMQILPFSKPFSACHLLKPMFLIWLLAKFLALTV